MYVICYTFLQGEAQCHSAEYVADAVKDVMSPLSPLAAGPGGETKSAADSLLPIIQSQRERFRLRAQELEAVSQRKTEIKKINK